VLQFLASLGSDLGFPSSQAKGFIAIPENRQFASGKALHLLVKREQLLTLGPRAFLQPCGVTESNVML